MKMRKKNQPNKPNKKGSKMGTNWLVEIKTNKQTNKEHQKLCHVITRYTFHGFARVENYSRVRGESQEKKEGCLLYFYFYFWVFA